MPRRLTRLVGAATAAAVAGVLLAAAPAEARPPNRKPIFVQVADPEATTETRSLFASLQAQQGEGVLFGHQHTNTDGASIADQDSLMESDVEASVGDFPAVFGWDGLAYEGYERPGIRELSWNENAERLADAFAVSDSLGGINTLSLHMPNFVTGGNYADTSGDVVPAILPGGAENAEFRAYLDAIAVSASEAKRPDGTLVPVIIRPFHENTGSWFWWGAGNATPSAYINLYRYTVEYLRDTKDVHNLLYAYSPNGVFGGDPTNYMKTYPGDAYVDVLGYDFYDQGADADAGYLDTLTTDLRMVVDLAAEHGKVPALTEFGPAPTFKPSGNPNPEWYTDVLAALKADPKAKEITYAQTWSNWTPQDVYVPYPVTGELPDHELLSDFRAFADDPYTVFASDLSRVYDWRTRVEKPSPLLRLVTPWDGQRITADTVTVRTRLIAAPLRAKVTFQVGDGPSIKLQPDDEGFYSGTWQIDPSWLDNRAVTVTTTTQVRGEALTDTAKLYLGEKPVLDPGWVDNFENYAGESEAMLAEYTVRNGATLALDETNKQSGDYGAAYGYDLSTEGYTGVGKSLTSNWAGFSSLRMWLKGDGSPHALTIQVVADGIYFEYVAGIDDTKGREISAPFNEFAPAPWDTANAGEKLTPERAAKVTQVNLYINQRGDSTEGTIYLDDIRAE